MPVELTTPADGGVITGGESYPHAKIHHWEHFVEDSRIRVLVVYGTVDEEGNFTRAPYKDMKKEVYIDGQDYVDIVTNSVAAFDGENIYAAVKRTLYQWLITRGHLEGTVV